MSDVITQSLERIRELKPYLESLQRFTGSIGLGQAGLGAKNQADYQRGLSGIQTASVELAEHLDDLKDAFDKLRAGVTPPRSAALLAYQAMIRGALQSYADSPADALRPATGGDPKKPLAVGFATAQRWVDLVSQIKQGEWAEAREREKLSEYAIAIFAFGPAGVIYVLARESGYMPDVSQALGNIDQELGISEGLKAQAERLDRIWYGVKVAAGVTAGIATLFGVGYLVRSFRSAD